MTSFRAPLLNRKNAPPQQRHSFSSSRWRRIRPPPSCLSQQITSIQATLAHNLFFKPWLYPLHGPWEIHKLESHEIFDFALQLVLGLETNPSVLLSNHTSSQWSIGSGSSIPLNHPLWWMQHNPTIEALIFKVEDLLRHNPSSWTGLVWNQHLIHLLYDQDTSNIITNQPISIMRGKD